MEDAHHGGVEGVLEDAQGDLALVALLGQAGGFQAVAVALEDVGALPEEGRPRRGQGDAAGVAVEQLHLQLLLQGRDGAAQGRLGHEQGLRRLGEIEPLGQHHKALQLVEGHRLPLLCRLIFSSITQNSRPVRIMDAKFA